MSKLVRLDELNREIYLDTSQIVYLQLNPTNGKLVIGLAGGTCIEVANGRRVLNQLQAYLNFNEIEVDSDVTT